jgi:uncharacterized protein YcaQ
MSVPSEKISAATARRIALAAQGFGRARTVGAVDAGHLMRVVRRLGLFQIDSVNVVSRAHYLPLFSRIGAYPRGLLDAAAWGRPRRLFEYWAHEASLLPLSSHPLLRWRMARAERGERIWKGLQPFAGERRAEADRVLARIAAEGPLATSDFGEERGQSGWWEWGTTKRALEYLFWSGKITTASRRGSFERIYDLPERVLPPSILSLPTPDESDAQRQLMRIAAAALGIAAAPELRDYFRLPPEHAKARLTELVEEGALRPVTVEGWKRPAYLHAEARRPRRIEGQALLAPFDPLIWERERTERIFGLRYRIGIYTPAEQRTHGYYVLPFLMDEALVARVDLKADRAAGLLRVLSAHAEPDAPAETAERLTVELQLMAGWLGLSRVVVEPVGDLAGKLASTVDAINVSA